MMAGRDIVVSRAMIKVAKSIGRLNRGHFLAVRESPAGVHTTHSNFTEPAGGWIGQTARTE
jgi:hypothetical protein